MYTLSKNKYFYFAVFFAMIFFAAEASAREKGKPKADPVQVKKPKQPLSLESGFNYDSKGKRDPFLPLVSADGRILEPQTQKETDKAVKLEGIIYDSRGMSYAIINSKIAKVGDMVGGYQVLRIRPQKVILTMAGQEFEVELKKED